MKKLKRYMAAILIFVSYHAIDADWRDWFNWTSWKNWWTNTRTNQLLITQPEISPEAAQKVTTATIVEAFKQKTQAQEQLQGAAQPLTGSTVYPSPVTMRKIEAQQIDQINDFLHEAYIFFSDVSHIYRTQYNNEQNFDESFKQLTEIINPDKKDPEKNKPKDLIFLEKLQGIKDAGVPEAIVDGFKKLIPIPWNYLEDIKTFIDNLESIDEKVKIDIQGDLLKSDPAFSKQLYEYGKQDITLDQIPVEDQLKLLRAYRKYQIRTTWKNLYEGKNELKEQLKKINPKIDIAKIDIAWISHYA